MTIDQRTALDVLTRPRLLEIGAAFDLDLSARLRKSEMVDALAGSRRTSLARILDNLKRDELKAICRTAGIDDSGRTKAAIADRILRHGDGGGRRRRPSGEAEVETLTRAELVEAVAGAIGLPKTQAEVAVGAALESFVEALRSGSTIELRGFGSFGLRRRGPRTGRNPKTGKKVEVPAKRVPFFKPSKALRTLLN
jgi:integration host factor subunit beta